MKLNHRTNILYIIQIRGTYSISTLDNNNIKKSFTKHIIRSHQNTRPNCRERTIKRTKHSSFSRRLNNLHTACNYKVRRQHQNTEITEPQYCAVFATSLYSALDNYYMQKCKGELLLWCGMIVLSPTQLSLLVVYVQ